MKMRLCEIVQQLDYINMDIVKGALESKKGIRDYAYIVHNKDVDGEGNLKSPHIHIALRLNNMYDSKYIAQWFNVGEQYVNKVKGRWSDMLSYLTHKNAPEKFQYEDNEVVSNFDWVNERSTTKVKRDERKEEILNLIDAGIIREYNIHDYLTVIEYDKYKKNIDNAFKFRMNKLMQKVERKMDCYFITGKSGTGKTTYAKQLAKERGYSVYISSGSNDVLDSYQGQDCIILDDLRPSCMGLSDLLKMLDNNTSSTVKSRYKNKVLECKLIIITTTLDIDTFFSNVFKDQEESCVQLKRRCKYHLTVTAEDIFIKKWYKGINEYSKPVRIPNPNRDLLVESLEEEMLIEDISEEFGVPACDIQYRSDLEENSELVEDEQIPF
ncbi:Rep family protein [Clostridium perfringens]|uniref:Rep family protein n=1 Tax=Clostridium perfringens TaxID=1502 RepID=UPI0022E113F5|nr:Rep family protein [Clostridium perfringens]